jgi:hypothetical protein
MPRIVGFEASCTISYRNCHSHDSPRDMMPREHQHERATALRAILRHTRGHIWRAWVGARRWRFHTPTRVPRNFSFRCCWASSARAWVPPRRGLRGFRGNSYGERAVGGSEGPRRRERRPRVSLFLLERATTLGSSDVLFVVTAVSFVCLCCNDDLWKRLHWRKKTGIHQYSFL